MKKKINLLLVMLVVLVISATTVSALECSVQTFKINGSSNNIVDIKKGTTASFYGEVKYDSTVYGVPIPVTMVFEASIPYYPFQTPTYVGGTFQYFNMTKKISDVTGIHSYVERREWTAAGVALEVADFRAFAELAQNNTKASIGTGVGNNIANANYIKTINVK